MQIMLSSYISAKLSSLPSILRPLYDALTTRHLPWSLRWRTLTLLPLNILTALITAPTWLFNNRYSVLYIPTRSGPKRCLVYLPPSPSQQQRVDNTKTDKGEDRNENKEIEREKKKKKRPLHIDAHGGAFLGGLAEYDTRWCTHLSDHTGAVVVSIQYRGAARYTYPAAHDDVDDIMSWLLEHAEEMWDVDLNLVSVGGSSAGANLLLSAARGLAVEQRVAGKFTDEERIWRKGKVVKPLAWIGFCPVLDLRVPPVQKPKPAGFPKKDPLRFLMPLFDSYAAPSREERLGDARLHPTLARKEDLPRDMLVVVAGIDILAGEQLEFVERVRGELEREGNEEGRRRVEAKVFERGFHGWLECEYFF